ncbi:hypothetical protein [Streptomyces mexicanus]|jgi:hypothetical protein|uniref:Bacterial Ig domain-containing protein n=1 Tax=Streptomyces mexicanus TaxID=178566 RepID=A0A7X1I338_9ACTN|nr:hypothetical protein [Streptomyces mexicanus]MBC2867927.1 hypothetical protein [Streptomyces mexicanus]
MHATARRRCARALAAGALSAALVSAGGTGAFAADTAPKPSPTHSTMPMTKMSVTAKADRMSVKTGHAVTLTGHVKGVKTGTKLVLQHLHNGKWTTLRSSTMVKKNGSYSLPHTFTAKGTEHLRVATSDGKAHSSTVTVKVA